MYILLYLLLFTNKTLLVVYENKNGNSLLIKIYDDESIFQSNYIIIPNHFEMM